MAKLPRWIKVIETQNKGLTVVVAIRWWHPSLWIILWKHCRQVVLDGGCNPNALSMRWAILRTVAVTIWQQSKRSWTF